MQKKKCTSCGEKYDLQNTGCPACGSWSNVLVAAPEPVDIEDSVRHHNIKSGDSHKRVPIPYARTLIVINGIAFVVFILLALVVRDIRESAAGLGALPLVFLMLPIFFAVVVSELFGTLAALVMLATRTRKKTALILLAISVPPLAIMAFEWFQRPQ